MSLKSAAVLVMALCLLHVATAEIADCLNTINDANAQAISLGNQGLNAINTVLPFLTSVTNCVTLNLLNPPILLQCLQNAEGLESQQLEQLQEIIETNTKKLVGDLEQLQDCINL